MLRPLSEGDLFALTPTTATALNSRPFALCIVPMKTSSPIGGSSTISLCDAQAALLTAVPAMSVTKASVRPNMAISLGRSNSFMSSCSHLARASTSAACVLERTTTGSGPLQQGNGVPSLALIAPALHGSRQKPVRELPDSLSPSVVQLQSG